MLALCKNSTREFKSICKEDLKQKLDDYIMDLVSDMEEEGMMCLDECESQGDFHMTTYWLEGPYSESLRFIKNVSKEYYADFMYACILKKYESYKQYPCSLKGLELKVKKNFKAGSYKAYLAYEALASILLREYQGTSPWKCVYGAEFTDMIDMHKKYAFKNALTDSDFPVLRNSNLAAAMLGDGNNYVESSSCYDVFAFLADELQEDDKKHDEAIFTPDAFQYEAVVSRHKCFHELLASKKSLKSDLVDYYQRFSTIPSYDDEDTRLEFVNSVGDVIYDKYMHQFEYPPYSHPLKDGSLLIDYYKSEDNKYKFIIMLNIIGVQNKKFVWKHICNELFDIPRTPEETQQFVIHLAEVLKIKLAGKEKPRSKNNAEEVEEFAIEGKYPRKNLATHGLNLDHDKITFSMADQQSIYIIKKSLRYSKKPVISCSWGKDSVTVLHQTLRVDRNISVLMNNSLSEYGETMALKDKLLKQWGIVNFLECFPKKGVHYFGLVDNFGWNFEAKGSRKDHKISNSERCCYELKHRSTFDAIKKYGFDVDFSGLRGVGEGRNRTLAGKRDSIFYRCGSDYWNLMRANPIIFYDDELVRQYHQVYNVPHSKIYDMILWKKGTDEEKIKTTNYFNVDFDDPDIAYMPRTGCQYCLVTASKNYLAWLKSFKPKEYYFLMKTKGLAKTLYALGMKYKVIKANTVSEKPKQLSLFSSEAKVPQSYARTITDTELDSMSFEYLENLIERRPCMFTANLGK